MSDQLRLKLFIEVEGKVLLRIVKQGSLLQELKSELSPDDGSIISLTYFYADSSINLDTERDLEALMDLATIDNVTTFKVAAHIEHNVEDGSVKKKRPRIPESPAAMERRRAAAEQLRLERAAQGIVVKRGRPIGSKNKLKTEGTSGTGGASVTSGVSSVCSTPGDNVRSVDYSEEEEE